MRAAAAAAVARAPTDTYGVRNLRRALALRGYGDLRPSLSSRWRADPGAFFHCLAATFCKAWRRLEWLQEPTSTWSQQDW